MGTSRRSLADPRSETVDVDGVRIHVLSAGTDLGGRLPALGPLSTTSRVGPAGLRAQTPATP